MTEAIFRGISGRLHRFSVHRPHEQFAQAPAVYCFARPGPGGRGWTPLFLSRTGNLSKRLASHEQWPEAQLLGATHILIHQHDERDAREYVEADLADLDEARAVIAAADRAFGRIDILVNAAGITDRGTVFDTSPALFERMMAINLRAPFFLLQDWERASCRRPRRSRRKCCPSSTSP